MRPDTVRALSAYLPELTRRALVADGGRRDLETAVLFADITGFTALTHEFAGRGREGAERLSAILADYLGRLQSTVAAHGGDVVAFAGDALRACWPDHDRASGAHLAAQSALAVRDELNGFDAGAGVRLRIKCSVGAGSLSVLRLGGVGGRWYDLVDGSAVQQLPLCNERAEPGDVVLSAEAARDLHSVAHLEDRAGVALLVSGPEPLEPEPLPTTVLPAQGETTLRGFVPFPVVERVEAGQHEWLSEFRTVSTVFAGLGQIDYEARGARDRLQQVVEGVERSLDRYGGLLLSLRADDKGVCLVAAFGLPNLRHEDDPARAAAIALEVREAVEAAGLDGGVGVTTGLAYAGEIAAGSRRFYTLTGPPINLAARLMQAAGGGVLADEETARRSARGVRCEPVGTVSLKGLPAPVPVHRVRAGAASRAELAVAPLIGRRREVAGLERALAAARGGGAMTVLLEGEPGIGKSRLVDDLRQKAVAGGMRVVVAVADPVDSSVPYLAWREPVLDLLDWDRVAERSEAQRDHVERRLAAAGAQGLAPLLGPILPVELPDDDVTAGLTGDARAERTREVLTRLVEHAAADGPMLAIVEDAHWLDSLSWALLVQLSERVDGLALVVASRPPDDPTPAPYAQLAAGGRTSTLRLDQLTPDEALELVRRELAVRGLPEAVEELLRERAGGHPLYAREIGFALQETGALIVEGERATLAGGIEAMDELTVPDTIEGVVTSRIDRLSAPEQLSLKVAAVIGRVFAYRTLHDVHPVPEDRPFLPEQLRRFHALGLAHPENGADGDYSWHHAILRDVAYEHLTFAQRRRTHLAVGEWYERQGPPDERLQGVLAHHWGRAVDEDSSQELIAKAAGHLLRAAEVALANSAHAEAAGHLARAEDPISWLDSGPERDGIELQARSLTGYALMNMRGYGDPEVEGAYLRARELSNTAPRSAELGPVLYGLFSFYASRAEYRPASDVAGELIALGEQLEDPAARLVGDNSLGLASILRGELERGAGFCERSHAAADADASVGVLPQYGGDFRGYPRAWLSIAQCLMGRPDDALRSYEQALEVTRWHPYTHGFVLCFAGLPQLRRDAGATRRHAADLEQLAGRNGFMMLGAIAGIFLGWAEALEDGSSAGADRVEQSIAVPRMVALDSFMPWYMALLAEARAETGRQEEAGAAIEEGLAFARAAGSSFYEPELHRLAAGLARARGADREAEERLMTARRVARRQSARWWELRIATDRCRLPGAGPKALEELSAARAAVVGGADTPVVRDADAVLANTE